MKSRLQTYRLRFFATLLVSLVGCNCALASLIVVDLELPIEAVSLGTSEQDETPEPQSPSVDRYKSLGAETVPSFSSSPAVSAWLAPSSQILFDDDVVAKWFRDKGNVRSKIIPNDLLRPPQVLDNCA